jgi:hypothetical protein
MLAKIAALVAREILDPVISEYRKLGTPSACDKAHVSDRTYDVASTTTAVTERAPQWDHDTRPPVRAQHPVGFGRRPS